MQMGGKDVLLYGNNIIIPFTLTFFIINTNSLFNTIELHPLYACQFVKNIFSFHFIPLWEIACLSQLPSIQLLKLYWKMIYTNNLANKESIV